MYIQGVVDERQVLIAKLEERRRSLVAEITALQKWMAESTERLRKLQLTLESVLGLMRMEGAQPLDGSPVFRHFIEVAYDVLLEQGKALHYRDLAADLVAKGVFIPGQRPEANLLAHIGRDRRFKRVSRGVYEAVISTADERATEEAKRSRRRTRKGRAA